MKIFTFVILINLLLVYGHTTAQLVKLSQPDHISVNGRLSISVAAPVDITGKSAPIDRIFFINNNGSSKQKVLELNKTDENFSDSFLIKGEQLNPGIQSFFVHFPDTSERVFTCLVTTGLRSTTVKNVFERIVFTSTVGFYNLFSTKITTKISGSDSVTLMKGIPPGFKCIVVFDFFTLSGFDDQNNEMYCSVSAYNVGYAGNPTDNIIRDAFLAENMDSPLYALLSTGSLMGANSFLGSIESIKTELFPDDGTYEVSHSSNVTLKTKVTAGMYTNSNNFHRVFLYINN